MSATPDALRAQLIAALKGSKVPRASLDPTSPTFESIDDAAHGAFSRLEKSALEQAGIIYRNQAGKFQYSIPTSQGQRDGFALSAPTSKDAQIAAIFHTHPGDDSLAGVFSPNDVQVAKQLKVPSYIQFLKDSSVRSFTPGSTATRSMSLPGTRSSVTVADGDPVKLPFVPPATGLMASTAAPAGGLLGQ